MLQPRAFLSAPLPAAAPPPAAGTGSSSQSVCLKDPPACEAWTHVSPEDWALVRSLYDCCVVATAGGSGGGSGGGRGGAGSRGVGAAAGGFSNTSISGSSSIPLEDCILWMLLSMADQLFCDANGRPCE